MKVGLKRKIEKALKINNGFAVIAIDGMAASGKSTLAQELAREYDGSIVHMDDFFLPVELRTSKRLEAPGGNVHYERFLKEVLPGIMQQIDFEYGIFDCRYMKVCGTRKIKGRGLVIVEGAYALRPEFRNMYDVTVFMKIDSDIQMERIVIRNGAEKAQMFKEIWIPMENRYFEAFDVEKASDVVISTAEQNM